MVGGDVFGGECGEVGVVGFDEEGGVVDVGGGVVFVEDGECVFFVV